MKINKPLLLILLCVFIFFSCPTESEKPDNPWDGMDVMEFVSSMKIGWNLGNALDAHNNLTPRETAWGNPVITQSLINAVADAGFGAVRIPVTWGTMIGDAPRYTIDEGWLGRVGEVVEYVRAAGMRSIINIHHDGADSHYWLSVKNADLTGPTKTAMDAKFTAVWKQIALYFIDTGNYLVFEAFNELHDGSWGDGNTAQRSRVNELNQLFVNAVRSAGGENTNRFLVIPGWVTRPSVTVSSLVLPEDPIPHKLIVAIHFYDPYQFALRAEYDTWGSKARPGSWGNESSIRATFDSVKGRFIDREGVPVIIGEYGATRQATATGKAHRLYYMEYVTKYAWDCGFVSFYWDNGGARSGAEQFGLFNRGNNSLLADAADMIEVMMRAVSDDEDYTLDSILPP